MLDEKRTEFVQLREKEERKRKLNNTKHKKMGWKRSIHRGKHGQNEGNARKQLATRKENTRGEKLDPSVKGNKQ